MAKSKTIYIKILFDKIWLEIGALGITQKGTYTQQNIKHIKGGKSDYHGRTIRIF